MLQPVKSPKGHRLYRREDVDTVLRIKRLLYDEGFTIAGARRHLRERGRATSRPSARSETRRGQATTARNWRKRLPPLEPRGRFKLAIRTISRKVLLDLRDSLRAFLTLLETE